MSRISSWGLIMQMRLNQPTQTRAPALPWLAKCVKRYNLRPAKFQRDGDGASVLAFGGAARLIVTPGRPRWAWSLAHLVIVIPFFPTYHRTWGAVCLGGTCAGA